MAKNATIESYERIIADLHRKIYKPVYLLMGNEPYFIDQISNYITQNVLTEDEKAFNLIVLYGEDCTVPQVQETARRYPMMANQQVVVVREAQNMKGIEDFSAYASNPQPSTLLVLCLKGKPVDKRKALYKNVLKTGEILESVQFPSYGNDLENWITSYLKTKKLTIESKAANILTEALGADLGKIANELDKLMVLLPQDTTQITADHIERNVGISKDFNAFEFCNALIHKDILKTNRIIYYFEKNPRDFNISATLSAVFSQFTKLFSYQMLKAKYRSQRIPDEDLRDVIGIHPFVIKKEYDPALTKFTAGKVAHILSLIRTFDMRSKGWGSESTESGDLLRELAFLIMH